MGSDRLGGGRGLERSETPDIIACGTQKGVRIRYRLSTSQRRRRIETMIEIEKAKPLEFPAPFLDIPYVLIACHVPREKVTEVLGPPMLVASVDGLGDADCWAYEYPCGLQLVYQFQHLGKVGRVLADSPEIKYVLRHIPFARADCVPIDSDDLQKELKMLLSSYPERQPEIASLNAFQVWRQGDDGHPFKIGEPTSERDAKRWVQQFESSGHKQLYWYSRVDSEL